MNQYICWFSETGLVGLNVRAGFAGRADAEGDFLLEAKLDRKIEVQLNRLDVRDMTILAKEDPEKRKEAHELENALHPIGV